VPSPCVKAGKRGNDGNKNYGNDTDKHRSVPPDCQDNLPRRTRFLGRGVSFDEPTALFAEESIELHPRQFGDRDLGGAAGLGDHAQGI
jgi:hypothetical protein